MRCRTRLAGSSSQFRLQQLVPPHGQHATAVLQGASDSDNILESSRARRAATQPALQVHSVTEGSTPMHCTNCPAEPPYEPPSRGISRTTPAPGDMDSDSVPHAAGAPRQARQVEDGGAADVSQRVVSRQSSSTARYAAVAARRASDPLQGVQDATLYQVQMRSLPSTRLHACIHAMCGNAYRPEV